MGVYNKNTGDLVNNYGQIKPSELKKGFSEIEYTSIDGIQEQQQITPRQIRTGINRGDTITHNLYRTRDERTSRDLILWGYSEDEIF